MVRVRPPFLNSLVLLIDMIASRLGKVLEVTGEGRAVTAANRPAKVRSLEPSIMNVYLPKGKDCKPEKRGVVFPRKVWK